MDGKRQGQIGPSRGKAMFGLAGVVAIAAVALAVWVTQPAARSKNEAAAFATAAPRPSAGTIAHPSLGRPVIAAEPTAVPPSFVPGTPEPTAQPIAWTEAFTSARYRYSIAYPPGWRPDPSANDFEADTFTEPAPGILQLSITRRQRADGVSFDEQAAAWLPARHTATGVCRWTGGGITQMTPGGDRFREATIDGRNSLVRSECSYVDAVVDLGDEALLLVLQSARHSPVGDRDTFDRFVDSLAISDEASGPIPSPRIGPAKPEQMPMAIHISSRFGYSMAYPKSWLAYQMQQGLQRDEIVAPDGSRMTIRAVLNPTGLSAHAWAEANIGTWVVVGGPTSTGCRWKDGKMFIARSPSRFEDVKLADRAAAVRSECGVVDAVVESGDHVLLLSYRVMDHRVDGDRRMFDFLVSSLYMLAEGIPAPTPAPTPQPTESTSFVSARFRYSIDLPAGWSSRMVLTNPVLDEFTSADGSRLTIRMVSKEIATPIRDWARDIVSRTRTVDGRTGCAWPSGVLFIPRKPAAFVETTIAKRSAVIRGECGYVDAEVDLGGGVLVMTLRTPEHRSDGDRPAFDRLVSSLRLN